MTFLQTRYGKLLYGVIGITAASLLLGFFLFAAIATRDIPKDVQTADAIVVLTGGSERIAEAARLLKSGRAGHLLISGVNRQTSKATIRKLARIDKQTFTCCVTVGYAALNTLGNAVETRNWQLNRKFRSLIIVTAAYHMPRSMAELSVKMPGVKLIAHPVMPKRFKANRWWLHPSNAGLLAREYLKFLPAAAKFALNRAVQSQAAESGASKSQHAGTH